MGGSFSLFIVVLVYILAVEAQNQPIKPLVSAIYFFGDSTIDAGNNNWLHTNVKSNFPPYGRDFPGGEPTGRFTNGKLITDILAGLLGLPDLLPASLDTTFTGHILLSGASFGSSGAGLDDETSLRVSVMTMRQQIENFGDYRSKLSDYFGLENASNIVSGALFAISIGTDDFVNNYYQYSQTRNRYSLSQYQDLLIGSLRESLQSFIDHGATKIGVVGLPAFGCLPLQITLHNFKDRSCYEYFNDVARSFNAMIADLVESMKGSLPGVQIVYLDIYYELLDIVHNASLYGFEEAGKGCCGTGLGETSVMCNKATPTCPDASKYVFWDGFHPTTATYNIIANDLFQQIVRGLEQ